MLCCKYVQEEEEGAIYVGFVCIEFFVMNHPGHIEKITFLT